MRGGESLGLHSSMSLRLRLSSCGSLCLRLSSGELLGVLMLGVIDRLSGCALPERDPMGTLKKSISTYHRPLPPQQKTHLAESHLSLLVAHTRQSH